MMNNKRLVGSVPRSGDKAQASACLEAAWPLITYNHNPCVCLFICLFACFYFSSERCFVFLFLNKILGFKPSLRTDGKLPDSSGGEKVPRQQLGHAWQDWTGVQAEGTNQGFPPFMSDKKANKPN